MKKIVRQLLYLSLFLIFSASCLAQDEDTLYKIHVNDFSGGQNSFDLSNIISANQGTVVKNVSLNRRGKLSVRKGLKLFAQDMSNTAWTGIGRFTPNSNDDFLVVASGPEILRSTSAASWLQITTASPLSAGKNTEFIQTDKLLFILNGVNYPAWYDGTTFNEGVASDSPLTNETSPPIAKYGAWLRNYFFVAHGAIERDWVWFSNNLEPLKFTTTDVFKINTGDGQAIQAMRAFKLNELIFYKERSIWVLDITGATPLTDWSLQPILEDIGLIAPRSVALVGNDQWFLSSEPIGIRSLVRTDLDKIKTSLISQPIQDIFDGTGTITINKTHINKAASVFFDNKYILSLPTGLSTVNNTVLVFDALVNAWYLITGWFVEDWQIFDNKLYFIDSRDGRALQAFTGNNDMASGPIITATDIDGNASPEQVVGIDWHFESKAFDFESPELYKLLDSLEVVTETTGDYTIEVFLNLDGGGFESIGTMTLEGESTNLSQDLPFTLSSEKLARHTFVFTEEDIEEFREVQIGFDHSASDEQVELRSFTLFGWKRPFRRE